MKLVIGKEILHKVGFTNCYEIKIETMSKDGMEYYKMLIYRESQEQVLEEYAEFKTLQETPQDEWATLPFWWKWEEAIKYNDGGGTYASLESFKVKYYDEAGHRFKVKLVEEN